MESLVKSLLGKGQDHVYETMQNLIEDAEKVKTIEFDLKEVQIMLEKVKDENERDINEELFSELKEKDEEIEHLMLRTGMTSQTD